MTFEDLGLREDILKAVKDLDFKTCMPIQEQAIPVIMHGGNNLIALAQTGTGKTAAYALPILDRILRESEIEAKSGNNNADCKALILCPTRELCIQITNDCKKFSKYVKWLKTVSVYGGASIELQSKEIKRGADVIVATAGRLVDLLERGKVNISNVKYLVLDEADEMLNMGFKDDLDNIFSHIDSNSNDKSSPIQWNLFSATMPKEVESVAENYIVNPVRIQIGERNQGSRNVEHYYYLIREKDRYLALKRIADYYPDIYAIVFCRTKKETQEVADMLIKDGYNADSLHGDLSQAQRDHVMSRFRLGNIQLLVATDVAARGLDVSNLTHVINYELPDDDESYVHRSGRTGRVDKQGISIAIINVRQKKRIKELEKIIGKEFHLTKIPTKQDVCKKQLFNLINRVENVDVETEEIDAFISEVDKKLSYLSREDLIRHFVGLQFKELLSYYKDAQDLNVDESRERNREIREKHERNRRTRESRKHNNGEFIPLIINVGYEDKIVPQRIIGMINDYTPSRRIEVGKIDISDKYTYIEIKNDGVDDVIDALNGRNVRGKRINIQIGEAKQKINKRSRQNNNSRHGKNRNKR